MSRVVPGALVEMVRLRVDLVERDAQAVFKQGSVKSRVYVYRIAYAYSNEADTVICIELRVKQRDRRRGRRPTPTAADCGLPSADCGLGDTPECCLLSDLYLSTMW